MNPFRLFLAIFLLGGLLGPAHAGIGEIFYADGEVMVQRGGVKQPAVGGYSLEVGDVVSTGARSQVRMRFQDDSYVALTENTSLNLEQYVFSTGRNRQPSVTVFSLLRGGLRTISGLIGNWSKDTYQMKAQVITMGIRGTEYATAYCKNNCPPEVENGGYLAVFSGEVEAANPEGSLALKQGEFAEAHSPPAKVSKMPAFFAKDRSGLFSKDTDIRTVPGALEDSLGGLTSGGAGVPRIERTGQTPNTNTGTAPGTVTPGNNGSGSDGATGTPGSTPGVPVQPDPQASPN